jgi:hypothetical protein
MLQPSFTKTTGQSSTRSVSDREIVLAKSENPFAGRSRWQSRSSAQHANSCLHCSLAWIEMRMIVVHLLRAFDLVGLEDESRNWIERQRIFFLWEKLPLRVRIEAVDGFQAE